MQTKSGVLLIIGAVTAALVVGCVIAFYSGLHMARMEAAAHMDSPVAADKSTLKILDLICEIRVSMPTTDLDSPRRLGTRTVIAGIDFATHSGWYQGEFTISETRKGTVTEQGGIVRVSRPALFQRFGATVTGEEFTVNRADGSFHQFLLFDGDRKLEFSAGYCGRYIKAPF